MISYYSLVGDYVLTDNSAVGTNRVWKCPATEAVPGADIYRRFCYNRVFF
jgi:hypothetical protein